MRAATLLRWVLAATLATSLGCQFLLPTEDVQESAFKRFDAAQQAFDAVIPGETTSSELRELGIDPTLQGVSILPYNAVARYFVPHKGVGADFLDPAVLRCIATRERCWVWLIEATRDKGTRDTWVVLDWLGIHVRKRRQGFSFEGMVLVQDDVASFVLYRGRPRYRATEERIRPLGPLQSGPNVKIQPLSSEPRSMILGGGKDLQGIELPSPIIEEMESILERDKKSDDTSSEARISINTE